MVDYVQNFYALILLIVQDYSMLFVFFFGSIHEGLLIQQWWRRQPRIYIADFVMENPKHISKNCFVGYACALLELEEQTKRESRQAAMNWP